jgi:hypothetical protein
MEFCQPNEKAIVRFSGSLNYWLSVLFTSERTTSVAYDRDSSCQDSWFGLAADLYYMGCQI